MPAVRTDYWTELDIFLLKTLSDEIVRSRQCVLLEFTIYINLYMYSVSCAPVPQCLLITKVALRVARLAKAQIQLKSKAGIYCCIFTYCMR